MLQEPRLYETTGKRFPDGFWIIDCEQLPELFLFGEDNQRLIEQIPEVLKFLLEKNHNYTGDIVHRHC